MNYIKTNVLVKKLRNCAKVPSKSTSGSAGFDIFAAIEKSITLARNATLKIPSGVSIELPSNDYVAFLLPRSGLSINKGIILANSIGVIDSDFRGEIIVGLKNCGCADYQISPGDKVAQLLFLKTESVHFKVVEALHDTLRGTGGLGSTGS